MATSIFSHSITVAGGAKSITARLAMLHDRMLETIPAIDRVSCSVYDKNSDMLKTYINSTRVGDPIAGYEFRLSDSRSLSGLAKSGDVRVIDDIPAVVSPTSKHSSWLLDQGYQSSFTVPMYSQEGLLGFVFFNSCQKSAFTAPIQRDLILFSNLINMNLSNELDAVRSIIASVKVARDFANLRDFETGAHIERMARNSRIIAKAIAPKKGLTDEFVEHVYLFAPMHDIGKIGIPDKILLKPGPLDSQERSIMNTHVDKGVALIDKIVGDFHLGDMPDSSIMRNIVWCHHEFMDGSGYPRGLKGEDIPLEARIVTVADILDALASRRPYKTNWPLEKAIDELKKMALAGKLDPDCVAAVGEHKAEVEEILVRYQDGA